MQYTHLQIQEYVQQREHIIAKLEESIQDDDGSDIYRDAIIQRFEFTLEFTRKILKKIIAYKWEDDDLFSKDIFRKFQSYGLINDIHIWFELINERNKLSHMYGEEIAIASHALIVEHKDIYRQLFIKVSQYLDRTQHHD